MRRLSALSMVLAIVALAQPARAEWFADAYLGPAITTSNTLEFEVFNREQQRDVDGRSSPSFGVRFGRWLDDFELPWLGVALDLSYFRPSTDVQTIPLTLLFMARYGLLKDDEFKRGRLHLYGAVGGGLFVSNLSGSIGFLEGDDTSSDMGLDTRVGVSYHIDTSWALFTEYRFTHVSPSWAVDVFGGETSASTSFNTHHIVLGLSYRF